MTLTTSSYTDLTTAELARARRRVLADIDITEDELCERAHTTGLCSDEWAALAALEEIDRQLALRATEHRLAS
ncbi:hypothetical protein [Georgenia wangjunii]|uniref:hypothetical protein n=1 Tax=Georgenia wangjunii TaxID=3117730 RepID=UPI002F264CF9